MATTANETYFGILNDTTLLFETREAVYPENSIMSGKVKRRLDDVDSASFKLPYKNSQAATIAVGDKVAIHRGYVVRLSDGSIKPGNPYTLIYGYVSNVERDAVGNADVTVVGILDLLEHATLNFWATYGTTITATSVVLNRIRYSAKYFSGTEFKTSNTYSVAVRYRPDDELITFMEFLKTGMNESTKVSGYGKFHFWGSSSYTDGTGTYSHYIYYAPEEKMDVCAQTVEFGKNISSLETSEDFPEATIIRAAGTDTDENDLTFDGYNGIKNAVACEDSVSKVMVWDDVDFGSGFESADALKAAAQEYIDENGKMTTSYEIDAVDLHWTDTTISEFSINKRVNVVSEVHGINDTLPISELEINLCNPLKTKISVGASRPRITR